MKGEYTKCVVDVTETAPKVELFVNGRSVGEKTAEDHFFYFDIPPEPKKQCCSDSGIFVFHKDITVLQYFGLLNQIKLHFDREKLIGFNQQLNGIPKSPK